MKVSLFAALTLLTLVVVYESSAAARQHHDRHSGNQRIRKIKKRFSRSSPAPSPESNEYFGKSDKLQRKREASVEEDPPTPLRDLEEAAELGGVVGEERDKLKGSGRSMPWEAAMGFPQAGMKAAGMAVPSGGGGGGGGGDGGDVAREERSMPWEAAAKTGMKAAKASGVPVPPVPGKIPGGNAAEDNSARETRRVSSEEYRHHYGHHGHGRRSRHHSNHNSRSLESHSRESESDESHEPFHHNRK